MTDNTKKKVGRPSLYSAQLAEELLARLVGADTGEARSLVSVCRDDDMPGFRTVMAWLDDERYIQFQHNYVRAREHQTEFLFEEMRDLARNPVEFEQITVRENEKGEVTREEKTIDNVPRTNSYVDVLKWQLARMSPKKYGDKMQVESKTDITHHYNEDDTAILDRLAADHVAQKTKPRKPKPQEDKDA